MVPQVYFIGTDDYPHGYFRFPRVMHISMGTEDGLYSVILKDLLTPLLYRVSQKKRLTFDSM